MPKNKKRNHAGGTIPYAVQLQMKKQMEIARERNDAARIAMWIACVALNDTEGLSYVRLTRFAKQQEKLTKEYYQDPVMGEAHLTRRIQQLGFRVQDGVMQALLDEKGEAVPLKKEEEQGK